ncbi:peptide ABC transporter ATP-binding protein [Aerococcus urinaehominis]|uniref:Peptide ABC transporter ATP-binding protein n=1 Tax=Aerococcus urinaehominis TaxID=128944 RepID=A0A109RH37_9LACT|nr:peptide ABC transporter ATP-binding protein [Aerococcus urinaehominis]
MIELRGLNKYYGTGENQVHVLKDINLTINQGEFVSVMGPSGSGKSTLINVVGFLDNKFTGDYLFQGQPLNQPSDLEISKRRNQFVGFIFQSFNLIPNMTIADNVRLPLLYRGMAASQTHDQVEQALARVGLAGRGDAKPYELSGGQKQRVAIARALINQPSFIIADEPTGALDTKTSRLVMDIIASLHQEEGVTILMVTHDPTLQAYADRHITIVDGTIKSDGQEIFIPQAYQDLTQVEGGGQVDAD